VEWVSETANHEMQTCDVRMKEGRIPEPSVVSRHLTDMGLGLTLRGMEATVEGELVQRDGALWLDDPGLGQPLQLGPLKGKVQWDLDKKRERPASRSERSAYDRLRKQRMNGQERYEVVGPLMIDEKTGLRSLEVRSFRMVRKEREVMTKDR
jgi:hypothetical protein